jgi:S1-C subfamily serine protease
VVAGVSEGGAAARAGVRPGDLVVGVNAGRVTSFQSLVSTLRKFQPGETIVLQLQRSPFQVQAVEVTLDGWEAMPDVLEQRFR